MKDYQNLMVKSTRAPNAGPILQNHHSVTWAICVAKSQTMFKGLGVDAFQEFLSSSFIADIPCEVWDGKVFDNLKNYAVDIILQMEDCPEFWKSFDPSNNVKIFHKPETSLTPTALNHQLFWRGSVKMRDPHNPSNFGHLEHAELSYGFDQLDLLTSQIREENFPFIATRVTFVHLKNLLRCYHFNRISMSQQKKTFCSFLELVSSFDANTVPFVFYTSTSLVLTVQGADPFWKAMDEKVSISFIERMQTEC